MPTGWRSPAVAPKINLEVQQKNGRQPKDGESLVAHTELGMVTDHCTLETAASRSSISTRANTI
jgi:hypothetical protein